MEWQPVRQRATVLRDDFAPSVVDGAPAARTPRPALAEGQHVSVVAKTAGWALVVKDDDTSTEDDSSSAHLIPLASLRSMEGDPASPSTTGAEGAGRWTAGPSRSADDVTGVDRVGRSLRSNLRKSLAKGDRGAFDKVHDQVSQLSEWRRQKAAADAIAGVGALPSSRLASSVSDSIARLVEASSQVRAGLVTPRTPRDEPATEHNTGVMQLLRVHMETEARLAGGVRVPSSASESLSSEVAKGTHGGPSIPNDRAVDVSGLWATAGTAAAAALDEQGREGTHASPLSAVADEIARGLFAGLPPGPPPGVCPPEDHSLTFVSPHTRAHAHGLVQLLVDVDVTKALASGLGRGGVLPGGGGAAGMEGGGGGGGGGGPAGLGQPCELFLSLWDSTSATWLGEDVVVQADARGRPTLPGRKASVGGDSPGVQRPGSAWSQAFFTHIPRVAAVGGRVYLVLRLFRRGMLKEQVAGGVGGEQGGLGMMPAVLTKRPVDPTSDKAAFRMHSMRTLLGRGREADAIYRRPVGVAVLPIPSALFHLADGTPHKPSEQVILCRPAKNDESRFFGLHRFLVSERERDADQDVRRKGGVDGQVVPSSEEGQGGAGVGGEPTQPSRFSFAPGGSRPPATSVAVSSAGSGKGGVEPSPAPPPLPPSAPSSTGALAQSSLGMGNIPLARVGNVGPFSVVVRAFTALPIPVLKDPRYSHLFAPQTAAGVAVSQPAAYQWRAPQKTAASAVVAGGVGRRARMARGVSTADGAGQESTPGVLGSGGAPGGGAGAGAPGGLDVTGVALSGAHLTPPPRLSGSLPSSPSSPSSPRLPSHIVHRDVLYVTLRNGCFAQDKKMTPRNVQVRVHVVVDTGAALPCLLRAVPAGLTGSFGGPPSPSDFPSSGVSSSGEGAPLSTAFPLSAEWRSAVYYHTNSPVFDETLAIHVPNAEQFERSHLRLSFWHASSTDSKTHPFSFAFLPLATPGGVTLKDGVHVLRCYHPPDYDEADPMTPSTSSANAWTVAKEKDGNVPPWYLVSPVVDGQGNVTSPATQRPAALLAAAEKTKLGKRQKPVLDVTHAAAGRGRHIPVTATPVPLAEQYPGVPLPAALTRVPSKGASGFLHAGAGTVTPVKGRTVTLEDPLGSLGGGGSPGDDDLLQAGGGKQQPVSGALGSTQVSEWQGSTAAQGGAKPSASYFRGTTSSSLVAALGLATSGPGRGKYERIGAGGGRTAQGTPAPYGATVEPWEAFPLELRPKDSFEVETRLVSDYKTSTPELHVLGRWRTAPPPSVYASVLQAQRMVTADPAAAARHFARLLPICLDMLAALLRPDVPSSSLVVGEGQAGKGGEGSAGVSTAEAGATLLHASLRTKSAVLSACVRLFAILLCSVASSVRPSAVTQGGGSSQAPLGQPVPSALHVSRMAPPAVDSFAAAHSVAALLAAGLHCPDGVWAMLRILQTLSKACAAQGVSALDEPGGKLSLPALQQQSAGEGAPASAAPPDLPGLAAAGGLRITVTAETLHALSRCMTTVVGLARVMQEQSMMRGGFSLTSSRDSLSSFRLSVLSVLLSLLGSLPDEGDHVRQKQQPKWLLVVHCALLRQLPGMLATLRGILMPGEAALLLSHALALPHGKAHPSHPLHPSTLTLRLSQLLCLRAAVRLRIVDDITASGGAPLSMLVPQLQHHLAGSGVQRALAVRVTAALLCQRDWAASATLTSGGAGGSAMEGGSKGVFLRQSWTLSLLLACLSSAVTGIVRSRPAQADVRPRQEGVRASLLSKPSHAPLLLPEQKAILRAARHARLRVPVLAPDGSLAVGEVDDSLALIGLLTDGGGLPASTPVRGRKASLSFLRPRMTFAFAEFALVDHEDDGGGSSAGGSGAGASNPWESDCRALSEAEYTEAFGPEYVSSSAPAGQGAQAHAVRSFSFVERFTRVSATAWASLVWGVPHETGPYLLATLAPLHLEVAHVAGAQGGDAAAVALVYEHARLRLALQLLHACLAFLSASPYPPTWLGLGQLMHTSILRVHRWVAGLLASSYSGSAADDASYWRWPSDAYAVEGGSTPPLPCSWALSLPVWSAWVDLTIALLTSPLFAPEALAPARRQAVVERYGDRRLEVCEVLRLAWGGALDSGERGGGGGARHPPPTPSTASWVAGVLVASPAAYADVSGATMERALEAARAASTRAGEGGGGGHCRPPSMCASLRLALAPRLVAPLLDLTHCVNPTVSALARDAYLDLLRAELTVQAARRATGGLWALLAAPNQAAGPGQASNSALPEMERLTIDTIDVLAAHKGPSLVVVPSSVGQGVGGAGGGGVATGDRAPSKSVSMAPSAFSLTGTQGKPQSRVAAIIRAASTDGGGVPMPSKVAGGGGSDRPNRRRRTTVHSAYVPPSDNLLMQLFAPKKVLMRARTATYSAASSAQSPALLRLSGRLGASEGLGASVGGGAFKLSGQTLASSGALSPERRNSLSGVSGLDVVTEEEADVESSGTLSARATPAPSSPGDAQPAPALDVVGTTPSSGGAPGRGGGSYTTLAGAADVLTHSSVVQFLGEIRTLYAMLSSVSKYPHTPDWEDERAAAALALISYLRTSHRLDMHAKYVTFLTDLHTGTGNAAEGALAHLLHADVLTWDEMGVEGSNPRALPPLRFGDRSIFPSQTSSARLESVLVRGMVDLEGAGCWEEAVKVGEILAARYEHVTCEYGKLADLLRTNARLYERMSSAPRIHASYFVVSYSCSPAFPLLVRGRTFVYRGGPGERLGDFEERLLRKWPGSIKSPFRLRTPGGPRPKPEHLPTGDTILFESAGNGDNEEDDDWDVGTEDEVDGEEAMEISFGGVNVVPVFPLGDPLQTRPCPASGPKTPSPLSSSALRSPLLHRTVHSGPDTHGGCATPNSVSIVALSSPVGGGFLSPPPGPATSASALSSSQAAAGGVGGGGVMAEALTLPRSLGEALHSPGMTSPRATPLASAMSQGGLLAGGGGGPPPSPATAPWGLPQAMALPPHTNAHVPGLIRKGREQAGARYFLHQRPFRKRSAKSGSDYLDLWVARTYLATSEAYPTTHRRSQVIAGREVALNPVEVALAGLRERTSSLQDLIERAESGADRGADQSFSATLQGIVDAAVSGGVANYRPLLDGSFQETHPEIAADLLLPGKGGLLPSLRSAIAEQVAMAGVGIRVHETKCAAENVPLHDFLVRRYTTLLGQVQEWGISKELGAAWR